MKACYITKNEEVIGRASGGARLPLVAASKSKFEFQSKTFGICTATHTRQIIIAYYTAKVQRECSTTFHICSLIVTKHVGLALNHDMTGS